MAISVAAQPKLSDTSVYSTMASVAAISMLERHAQQRSQVLKAHPMALQTRQHPLRHWLLRDDKQADIRMPEWLEVEFSASLSNMGALEGVFQIRMGTCTLWNLPFSLLTALQTPTQSKQNPNIWTIPLSLSLFLQNRGIHTLVTQFTTIEYYVEIAGGPDISNISLITSDTFLNSDTRTFMTSHSFANRVLSLESVRHTADDPLHYSIPLLGFRGVSRGYFIEGTNVSNIRRLTLSVGRNDVADEDDTTPAEYIPLWNLTGPMLERLAEPVSDRCFFLPFEMHRSYKDPCTDEDSILTNNGTQSLNMHQQEAGSIQLTLDFLQEPEQSNIGIHSLNVNMLKYVQGCVGLVHGSLGTLVRPKPINNQPTVICWLPKERPLDTDKNTECPTSHEEIGSGAQYYLCGECRYQFMGSEQMRDYIQRTAKCPMCRADWSDWSVYTNTPTNLRGDV